MRAKNVAFKPHGHSSRKIRNLFTFSLSVISIVGFAQSNFTPNQKDTIAGNTTELILTDGTITKKITIASPESQMEPGSSKKTTQQPLQTVGSPKREEN